MHMVLAIVDIPNPVNDGHYGGECVAGDTRRQVDPDAQTRRVCGSTRVDATTRPRRRPRVQRTVDTSLQIIGRLNAWAASQAA